MTDPTPTTPPPAPDVAALLDRIKSARVLVGDISSGKRKWRMRVPVQKDDPDVLLDDLLDDAAALIRQLQAQVAELERFRALAREARDDTKARLGWLERMLGRDERLAALAPQEDANAG